jgi:hypothetical protein
MSLAAIVVFAWARRLTAPRYALAAAAMTLAVPGFAYTGLLMTEVAYYPIAALALLLMARALETPTYERQAVAVAGILLASLTRLQGLALLPVLATAVVLVAVFERSTRILRRFAFALVLLVVAGGVILALHEGSSSGDMLGAYSSTASGAYRLGAALEWIVWHESAIFLVVAGVPLLAATVLAVEAFRGRERSPAARALLAVTAAYTGWTVVQVGIFASRFSGSLLERNLITLAPPLFVVFALWLERGLPRPQPLTALVTAAVLAPVVALPASRLTDPAAAPQALSTLAFHRVEDWASLGWTRAVWICGALALAAVFLLLPRRVLWVAPALVVGLSAGSAALAAHDVDRLAGALRSGLYGDARVDWVDASARGPVTYVFDNSSYWNGVWIRMFWNPRITRVVTLGGLESGPMPPHDAVGPRFDGRLFTPAGDEVTTPYVLAPERMSFAGTRIGSAVETIDGIRLVLWRIDPPARLTMLTSGFLGNGDFSGHAEIDVYDCRPGKLGVTLLGKDGSRVTLGAAGVRPQTVTPTTTEGTYVLVPAPPASVGGRCRFSLDTPGIAGTTVIRYVPGA